MNTPKDRDTRDGQSNDVAPPVDWDAAEPLAVRVARYEPKLDQRELPASVWDEWRPVLAHRVLTGATNVGQVTPMFGYSLDLIAYCRSHRIPVSPDNDRLWLETTRARFLRHLSNQGSSEASVSTAKSHLTRMASAEPNSAIADEPTLADTTPEDSSALFDTREPISVTRLGLTDPEPFWQILDLIGARVRAEHPSGGQAGSVKLTGDKAVPYGLTEVSRALRAIDTVKVASTRSAIRAMFALSLGAGIAGGTLARVLPSDVHHDGGAVLVRCRDAHGQLQRSVPVLAPFAPLLSSLAADGHSQPLLRGKGSGKSASNRPAQLGTALRRQDPHAVRVESIRLRATWLTIHLATGTAMPVLMRVAGVRTLQPFTDLMPYVPEVPTDLTAPWVGLDLSAGS